jgi:hypothetical protein
MQEQEAIAGRIQILMMEKTELLKLNKRVRRNSGDLERPDTDDTDSQFSYSDAAISPKDENTNESLSLNTNHSPSIKSSTKLAKQLVQETLMDEGLRVAKEIVESSKDEVSPRPPESVAFHPGHSYDAIYNRTSPHQRLPPGSHGGIHHHASPVHHLARPPSEGSSYGEREREREREAYSAGRVIATSGASIIAVTNPALSMSPYSNLPPSTLPVFTSSCPSRSTSAESPSAMQLSTDSSPSSSSISALMTLSQNAGRAPIKLEPASPTASLKQE